MKRSLLLTTLCATALIAPVLSWAQPPRPPMNRPTAPRAGEPQPTGEGQRRTPGVERRHFRSELGLTDAQVADIQKSRDSARRERLLKTTDLRIARMDIRSLLRAEKVDEKALAAKVAEAQAAQGALLKIKVDSALAMKRILTPEQQKRFMEMRGAHGRARMGQRMRMRGSAGPGAARRGQGMRRMMPGPQGGIGPGDDEDLDLDLLDFAGDAAPGGGDLR